MVRACPIFFSILLSQPESPAAFDGMVSGSEGSPQGRAEKVSANLSWSQLIYVYFTIALHEHHDLFLTSSKRYSRIGRMWTLQHERSLRIAHASNSLPQPRWRISQQRASWTGMITQWDGSARHRSSWLFLKAPVPLSSFAQISIIVSFHHVHALLTPKSLS